MGSQRGNWNVPSRTTAALPDHACLKQAEDSDLYEGSATSARRSWTSTRVGPVWDGLRKPGYGAHKP